MIKQILVLFFATKVTKSTEEHGVVELEINECTLELCFKNSKLFKVIYKVNKPEQKTDYDLTSSFSGFVSSKTFHFSFSSLEKVIFVYEKTLFENKIVLWSDKPTKNLRIRVLSDAQNVSGHTALSLVSEEFPKFLAMNSVAKKSLKNKFVYSLRILELCRISSKSTVQKQLLEWTNLKNSAVWKWLVLGLVITGVAATFYVFRKSIRFKKRLKTKTLSVSIERHKITNLK